MPELETLFVRIETDLSLFKQGMAEARRETRGFAKEARSTFSGVGAALDLSPFRRELTASEAAAKQSAERMKKAFAEVGKVQLESARQVLKTLAQSIDRQSGQPAAKAGAESGQSPGSNNGGFSDFFDLQDAFVGASIAGLLATILLPLITTATAPISVPMLAAAVALSGAINGLKPTLEKIEQSFSADDSDTTSSLDERIEELRRTIDDLKNKRLHRPRGGPPLAAQIKARDEELKKARQEFANALAQRDAIAEERRLAEEAAARSVEFIRAFTGLPDSLNQLGGRIDNLVMELLRMAGDADGRSQELLEAVSDLGDSLGRLCECVGGGPPPPGDPDESEPDGSRDGALFRRASFSGAAPVNGAAPVDGVGLDGVGFDRSQGGGQFTLASFAGAAPFGGAGLDGLDRGLADAGGRVQDLSAGFVELTQAASGFEAQGGSLVELLVRSNALLGEQSGLLGELTAQAPVLGGELTALFEESAEAGRVFGQVADALGASLLDAFEGAIARGESLSDVLKGLALDFALLAAQRGGETRRGGAALAPPAPASARPPVLAMAA